MIMKKQLLLAALVGVAFTSCVQNEEELSVGKPQEITFEVAKHKPTTRAEVDFSTLSTFGAYAFYENTATPGHSLYMDNVEIKHYEVEGSKYWASKEGEYFWPTQGHLDFVSYYPYKEYASGEDFNAHDSAIPTITSTSVGAYDHLAYNNFTNDPANPIDLMYSDKAMQQITNTSHYGFTGVPTLFHHALSKLNFHVKVLRTSNVDKVGAGNETKWAVTINSIKLNGIYNQGSLNLHTENAHDKGATTVQWKNQHSSGKDVWTVVPSSTTSKTWELDQLLTTNAVIYGTTTERAVDYFILPQELINGQQTITITYTVVTTAPGGQIGTKTHTAERSFKAFTAVEDWTMGKNITYTIEIDPAGDEIHFAPKVVDWENIDGVISI